MKLRHVGCLATLVCGGSFACSAAPAPGTGRAEVLGRATSALSVADVTRVAVTISGAHIDPSITSDLTDDASGWHGTIGDIPSGSADFHGAASDAQNAILYAGDSLGVDIVAGQTALVGLLMQQTQAPAGWEGKAPVIDSFFASGNRVDPGGVIGVRGTAHQADGDALTYSWTADAGSFGAAGSASTTWTAPATVGTYQLTFHATDQANGLSAAVTFSMSVQYATSSASVTASFNTWPTIDGLTASPTRIDVGETTNVSVAAADADGDTLSYAWTSDCTGTFGAPSASSTTFTLSALPQSGTCTNVATVSDGRGGSNTATVVLQAGPAPTPTFCPVNGFGGTADQSQYGGAGGEWEGVQSNTLTNTFTVGSAGVLTGVEVQVYRCQSTTDTSNLNLEIFDGSNQSLGTVTLPAAALASACSGDTVSPASVGPGLFDLSSLCIEVTPGEQLSYTLSLTGGTPGTCSLASNTCSNGGNFCMGDFDCQQMVGFSMTPLYDGGGTFLGDAFVYKTYVEAP